MKLRLVRCGRVMLARMLLSLAASCVALLIIEVVARPFDLDKRVVAQAVVFNVADPEVHRWSSDPFLHYELSPGAHYREQHGYSVNIDALGARFPSHPEAKGVGIFRILTFGGSTLYGARVDDEETIPAVMERLLSAEPASGQPETRRYEVWNFGTSGYNLGQATHLARTKLAELKPDLIIVQVHNRFPRPVYVLDLANRVEAVRRLIRDDPLFLDEQFSKPEVVPAAFNDWAIHHSALYRIAMGIRSRWTVHGNDPAADEISRVQVRALVAEAQAASVPVVFFGIPADGTVVTAAESVFPGLPSEQFVDLYRPGREPDFYEVHPEPAVLAEFADMLIRALRDRSLIPKP